MLIVGDPRFSEVLKEHRSELNDLLRQFASEIQASGAHALRTGEYANQIHWSAQFGPRLGDRSYQTCSSDSSAGGCSTSHPLRRSALLDLHSHPSRIDGRQGSNPSGPDRGTDLINGPSVLFDPNSGKFQFYDGNGPIGSPR